MEWNGFVPTEVDFICSSGAFNAWFNPPKSATDISDLCGLRKWYLLDCNRLTTKDEGIGLWKSAISGCLDPKAQELFVMLYSLYIYPVISLCILLKCKHIFLTSLS